MKKILITGSTSLLGRELLLRLICEKDIGQVVLLMRDNSGITPDKKIHLVYGDLRMPDMGLSFEARKLVSDVDEVYHLAANTDLGCENRESIFQTNVQGTKNLLAVVGANLPFFNYVSSAYACGNNKEKIQEDWLKKPDKFRNHYEESKWVAEGVVREHSERMGLPFRIYRPSILSYQNPTRTDLTKQTFYAFATVISKAGKIHHSTKPIRLPGDPDSQINIIFLEDVVNLMLETRSNSKSNIFNLTNDSDLCVQNLVNMVSELNGGDCSYVLTPNLKSSELSQGERYADRGIKPFIRYLNGSSPQWSTENTNLTRKKLGIRSITEEQIKENLRRYLKT